MSFLKIGAGKLTGKASASTLKKVADKKVAATKKKVDAAKALETKREKVDAVVATAPVSAPIASVDVSDGEPA